jgi:hypothetical protein
VEVLGTLEEEYFFCLFLFEGDGPVCIDEQAKERKRQVFFAAKVGIVAVFLDG